MHLGPAVYVSAAAGPGTRPWDKVSSRKINSNPSLVSDDLFLFLFAVFPCVLVLTVHCSFSSHAGRHRPPALHHLTVVTRVTLTPRSNFESAVSYPPPPHQPCRHHQLHPATVSHPFISRPTFFVCCVRTSMHPCHLIGPRRCSQVSVRPLVYGPTLPLTIHHWTLQSLHAQSTGWCYCRRVTGHRGQST